MGAYYTDTCSADVATRQLIVRRPPWLIITWSALDCIRHAAWCCISCHGPYKCTHHSGTPPPKSIGRSVWPQDAWQERRETLLVVEIDRAVRETLYY